MDNSSKRRRLDHPRNNTRNAPIVQSPAESSSDELAAGSDHDEARRRTSWSIQKAYPPKRPYPRSRSFSGSESPDELAVDAEEYWRSSRRNRGRRSPSPVQDSDMMSERYEEDEGEMDEGEMDEEAENTDQQDEQEDEAGVAEDEGDDGEYSDRSPTPVPPPPPPPPPKPDRLNYKEKYLLRGHLRGISAVRFSPDASMIASGGADGAIKIWDTLSGKLVHTFEGHLAGVSTIAWGPDGTTIASGSDDKTIRLWNVSTGKAHPIPFIGHHNYVYQIAFSPKGNMLVSGSYDEAVYLWDVRSARVMKSLPAHSDPVGGIDVVWDGSLIASCATDGLIRIWDTATGQCLRTLVHEDNPPVTSVKFSPNGKFVLAWTLDDCVRLWNYVEGRCIKTYQGHANRKYSIGGGFGKYGYAGIPPDAFAVSGSEDGSILCWDVVSKKVLQRIEGHNDVVLGVDTCVIENKRLLVSCGLDRTVRVWEEIERSPEEDQNDEQPAEAESESKDKDTDMTDTVENAAPQPNGIHLSNSDSNTNTPNGDLPNGDTQTGDSNAMME